MPSNLAAGSGARELGAWQRCAVEPSPGKVEQLGLIRSEPQRPPRRAAATLGLSRRHTRVAHIDPPSGGHAGRTADLLVHERVPPTRIEHRAPDPPRRALPAALVDRVANPQPHRLLGRDGAQEEGLVHPHPRRRLREDRARSHRDTDAIRRLNPGRMPGMKRRPAGPAPARPDATAGEPECPLPAGGRRWRDQDARRRSRPGYPDASSWTRRAGQ